MKRDRPTADEVRRAFDAELANSLTGAGPRTDSGLSPQVEDLLWDIADAHPDVPDSLVNAARAAVDQQVHDIENPPSRAESLRRLAAQAGIDLDDE